MRELEYAHPPAFFVISFVFTFQMAAFVLQAESSFVFIWSCFVLKKNLHCVCIFDILTENCNIPEPR